jgi:hypothetical protein
LGWLLFYTPMATIGNYAIDTLIGADEFGDVSPFTPRY